MTNSHESFNWWNREESVDECLAIKVHVAAAFVILSLFHYLSRPDASSLSLAFDSTAAGVCQICTLVCNYIKCLDNYFINHITEENSDTIDYHPRYQ
ncbi:hypothetical protein CEXT_129381 [Caerostris extrusa]|uniref:Uncharacterized protein n=1 Tax=Caerostris extrusa TaxID=172846 RepID=A0AAV4PXH7_CAEEX|nr:hypothetical protein CEXT_129381 [Caerostris extrusa]